MLASLNSLVGYLPNSKDGAGDNEAGWRRRLAEQERLEIDGLEIESTEYRSHTVAMTVLLLVCVPWLL